jgi:hypothetical protein
MQCRLQRRVTFQTTTGFLSAEKWRRCGGIRDEFRPYRKASADVAVPFSSRETESIA